MIGQSRWLERAALGAFSLVAIAVVVARGARHGLEAGTLLLPIMLSYFWYMTLAPVRVVLVSPDGDVIFENAWRRRVTRIEDILEVRPLLNIVTNDFVLKHRGGSELLFGDPTAVAALVANLRELGATFPSRGLPEPPGAIV
jgi:hypothetical protein